MVLEKQTESLIYQDGEFNNTLAMSLDLDSAQVLMQMLSKNLYSDPIGSTIRECASNALDSRRRANVSDPIIVSLKPNKESNSWEFAVEDFGMGLDNNDVENIISKYGKSTKRLSSNELGMFGLGFKSPLAYSSSFYFTCRKDGVERKYIMYEGEETNSIDLLYEQSTSERNGVKIIIPVKYSDCGEFIEKIKEQLAYFENVYFDVNGIDNNFKIHRSEHYQISDLCKNDYLHVCLDNVYYPLDFSKLDLVNNLGSNVSHLDISIGLRFSLTDGLFPTPNRESLRYTQEAKNIIKRKIELVANEMMIKYNNSIVDTTDILSSIKHYSCLSRYIKDYNNKLLNITTILGFSNIPQRTPVLFNTKYITAEKLYKIRDYILNEYEVKFELSRYKNNMSECKRYWDKQIKLLNIGNNSNIFVYEKLFPERKRRYMKELYKGKNAKFIKKSKPFTLFPSRNSLYVSDSGTSSYYNLLNLVAYDKSEWRDIIKEFQWLLSELNKSFINLDDIDIPQSWINTNSKSKSKSGYAKIGKTKEKGDINVKEAMSPEKETRNNAKFVPITYDGKHLHKRKMLTVYGKEENRKSLDYLYGLFKKVENEIKFVIMSDREIKLLETYNFHNFISLSEFLKGNNKPFKRMMTALLIDDLKNKHKYAFFCKYLLEDISINLNKDLIKLDTYSKNRINDGLIKTATLNLKEYAAENNLYDMQMLIVISRVEKILTKHSFINTLCYTMKGYYNSPSYNVGVMNIMKEMCRYKYMHMNLSNYQLVKNQEVSQLDIVI